MVNTKDFDSNKLLCCAMTFYVIMTIVTCSLPFLLTQLPISLADFSETGGIGDTIGGIMGPFVAIIASSLTFFAFWVQYKANRQQRNDIALERFENVLFQMIQIQEEITNNLYYTPRDGADNLYGTTFKGRHVFDVLYEKKRCFVADEYINGLKQAINLKGIDYYHRDEEIMRLDHYFRHLYQIIKFVDESAILDDTKKYEYTCIACSSLSEYELIHLFYNCLSTKKNINFKNLIEKYALLSNIRYEMLANEEERNLYEKKLNIDFTDVGRNFEKEYKKEAFIKSNFNN